MIIIIIGSSSNRSSSSSICFLCTELLCSVSHVALIMKLQKDGAPAHTITQAEVAIVHHVPNTFY